MLYINAPEKEERCLKIIRNNPRDIKYIKNKTFVMCVEAITLNKHCIWLLQDINKELFDQVHNVWRILYE